MQKSVHYIAERACILVSKRTMNNLIFVKCLHRYFDKSKTTKSEDCNFAITKLIKKNNSDNFSQPVPPQYIYPDIITIHFQ